MSRLQDDMQQVPIRVHINDHKLMKKLLYDEGITYQSFVTACIEAFLDGNPQILQIVNVYKEALEVPRSERMARSLSHRERLGIIRELEKMKPTVGSADEEQK